MRSIDRSIIIQKEIGALVAAVIAAELASRAAAFPPGVRESLHGVARVGLVLALTWLTLRLVDLGVDALEQRVRALVPGPRGIARALRQGRAVAEDQTVNTVELVGRRSTRVDALERYSAPDRTRFEMHLHFGLATTMQRLHDACVRIQALLACHPASTGDPPAVHVSSPGDAWFDVEAAAWFDAPDWTSFQDLCDQLLLACLDIVGDARATLDGPPPAPPGAGAGVMALPPGAPRPAQASTPG